MTETERRHVAGLMRVNHAGEVSAQALYHGQALMARSAATREFLLQAAAEEGDHLAWCEQRLEELKARPSLLNPFWYAGSFAIGAAAAAFSDALSLGFVTETERQVESHLAEHLGQLPADDQRSRRILETMQSDEVRHAQQRRRAGSCRAAAVGALRHGSGLQGDDPARLLDLSFHKNLAARYTYVIKSEDE